MAALLPRNYRFTESDQGVHTSPGPVLRRKGGHFITGTETGNGSLTAAVWIKVR